MMTRKRRLEGKEDEARIMRTRQGRRVKKDEDEAKRTRGKVRRTRRG